MREWSWENARDAQQLGLSVIGRGIRGGRLAHGLSQQQLAWRTGVNQSTISRLENAGLRSMRIGTLARIIGVLDMGPEFLFRGEPPSSHRRLPGGTT